MYSKLRNSYHPININAKFYTIVFLEVFQEQIQYNSIQLLDSLCHQPLSPSLAMVNHVLIMVKMTGSSISEDHD